MATLSDGNTQQENRGQWTPLNVWNQLAPRSYNRFVLCFAIENNKQPAAINRIKTCALNVGARRPVLRSLLKVDGPVALINKTNQKDIVVDGGGIWNLSGMSYQRLRQAGFPASAFLHRVFDVPEIPGESVSPALVLRIICIDGGLLLGIHLHHSLGDAKAIDDVISWLSAESRGESYDIKTSTLRGPFPVSNYPIDPSRNTRTLQPWSTNHRFPERTILSSPLTPSGRLTGYIFAFKTATLDTIRRQMQQLGHTDLPSTNNILISLLWAHVVKARMQAQKTRIIAEAHAKLFTLVDVRKHVFNDADQANLYFGNAVEAALTSLPEADLLKICEVPAVERSTDSLAKLLQPICRSVAASIGRVDRNFVQERHAAFCRVADPRNIAFDYSPNDPRSFMLNSWRYVGLNPG
ncbi:hypothetical protein NPX13_g5951 [Xylaria arbuscula]|uniref:Uncharacterized protein n=1 Tax=Xylaria arbuscula TaxID=114810 RepID=A0A9W8ND69_9PEZI|nr:hypothetical protein NPX13_g5951 [Xylaria arbuscula]